MENLPNEIFYEIFDYLDGYDIYQAFSNLINRFENLINSSLLMKIQISSSTTLDSRYKHFLDSNKHHIISLRFPTEPIFDDFIKFYTIDSSFLRLQSLVFKPISIYTLFKVLVNLKYLPHLLALTMYFVYCFCNLGDIYQMILHLPVLEYFKLKISEAEQFEINIPIAANNHFSSIKYLVIDHCCTINQLMNLLLYIPQPSHLSCGCLIKSNNNIKSEMVIKLNDLIHLTVVINDIDFNEFEEFLLKLCSQLQILNVKIHSSNKSYLNANRWEQLISQKMTSLNKFFFSYTDIIHRNFNVTSHPLLNDFTSSFWINRKWIFKVLAHDDELTYSIRPYS
ncbi:unnamed protein product [Rotaria sordida]|uniref:F-box domain-containing protein n=1 Tax=Rotaria sordida TaxID=392033 RepID=A0A815R669_9BILA|nr:unnamed protein product [Rotaria sordida]CAF3976801.1 unnamed protein product [Rotaria sordida]